MASATDPSHKLRRGDARISIRGFNQNQLGFTLDGVPLGDMTYGNLNGLHVSRAVISENLGCNTNSGDNQTLLVGAPQQVFVTVRKGFRPG